MRIRVLDYVEPKTGKYNVWFESEYGHGHAVWAGERPDPGCECEVEIEVPDRLEWGKTIRSSVSGEFAIREINECISLTMSLDWVDSDGCLAGRLGDSVVLLESIGGSPTVGMFVDVVVPTVVFYDVAL